MSLARGMLFAVSILGLAGISGMLFLSAAVPSRAVQDPTISLDMDTTGTTYDETTNTMTVGAVDSSSTSGNPVTHLHAVHIVINNVEDLVGWQARLNYVGDRMRPQGQNVAPFVDNTTAQNVGFTNLPIDQTAFVHRDITAAASIPAAPPDNTNTPQTALVGATYNGTRGAEISPDSPAKSTPDDSSYSAPSGGVLSQLALQVVGNECNMGPMTVDVDDGSPNPPGSNVVVFGGAGTTTIQLTEAQLLDGGHEETGGTCGTPAPSSTVSPAPTVSPTPTPEATPPPPATPTPLLPCPTLPPPLPTVLCIPPLNP